MIPTMILLGLVLGRWWWQALVVAAVSWPALLLLDGTLGAGQVVGASLLAVLNAAVGVGMVQGALWLWRRWRRPVSDPV